MSCHELSPPVIHPGVLDLSPNLLLVAVLCTCLRMPQLESVLPGLVRDLSCFRLLNLRYRFDRSNARPDALPKVSFSFGGSECGRISVEEGHG